jgi:sugar lactone lactonase YvrE
MSMTLRTHVYPLICLLGLASCGGGGGGGNTPPPPSPPAGDTTPPDTTLLTTPPARTNQQRVTFGVSTEAGAIIETSLNGSPYAVVAAIFAYENLAEGDYIARVRARDAAGNVDPTPATHQWTVDLTAPDTTVTSTTGATSNSSSATFTLAASEAGSTFEASLDGGAYAAVTSPWAVNALADGAHTISVRAVDSVTNKDPTPAAFQWTVDRTPPDTTITSTPSAKSNSASATFTLANSDAGGTFEASLDGGAYTVTTSPLMLTALADGAHTISVQAIDAAANPDPTPATFTWQIDTIAPTARVVFPSSTSYTDATQLHVRGTALDTSDIASVRVNGVAATSTDGFAHWSAVVPLSIGDNLLAVSVTDDFSNTNSNAASVTVANRGVVLNSIMSLAFDANGGRLLVTDPERRALLASRVLDRNVTVISNESRGTGPLFQQPSGLTLDGARALVTDTSLDSLIEVNLATGNRVELSPSAGQADLRVSSPLAYQASTQRAFVGTLSGTIVSIDLANGGARTVLSGGSVGTGTAFTNIRGIVLDGSTGTSRLLVADGDAHAIIAVDLTTGNRSIVSYAAPLDPNNQVGSGPSVYSLGQLALDETGHRVLVPDVSPSAFVGRLFSIDLATGNRTVLTSSTSDVELHFPNSVAFDPAAGKIYFGMSERGRVFRYDVASTQVTPFVDSNVGSGYVLNYPYGVLFDSFSGTPALYSLTRYPAATSYRIDVSNGVRFALANHIGPTGLPTNSDSSNLVTDARAGAGKALFLDTPFNDPVMNLHALDLTSGALSLVASTPFPDWHFMSRMAPDFDNNRLIVGLTPAVGGAGNIVAMDLTTGALTTLSSLSAGNGPPMYEIGAVASVPGTFGTTARVLVGSEYSLFAVNGQGDRNYISAASTIGSGPHMIHIEDMVVDFPRKRALVASGQSQALQWVDLTTGNRTMASGLNPGDQTVRGSGPPLFGRPVRLATDLAANVAYVTSMQTIILAVDLDSGDRVIISR